MKSQLNKEGLEYALASIRTNSPELEGFILVNSDSRVGKKIALAKVGDMGCLHLKTDYLTYAEMNQFLRGYSFKAENRFEKV